VENKRNVTSEGKTVSRPTVDVVVPFVGNAEALMRLCARLSVLQTAAGDTVNVVDNTRMGVVGSTPAPGVEVLHAGERQSSYFARNAGAARHSGEWLIFLDDDVEPEPDLIARYGLEHAAPTTAILAGGITDGTPETGSDDAAVVRYTMLRNTMSQDYNLGDEKWAYALTANCAVRRVAFDQVAGFRGFVRSGGDADLAFRVRAAGWGLERRDDARVVHRSRSKLRKVVAQRARHGAGAAWLEREHPGSFPAPHKAVIALSGARKLALAVVDKLRGRDDEALLKGMDVISLWAFELGRQLPNESGALPSWAARGLERLLIG
jgi:GT2 family glycosyltransferase